MNNFLQTLLNLISGLLGGGTASAQNDPDPVPDPDTSLGAGGGDDNALQTLSNVAHALVLPDHDFRTWYEATVEYRAAFQGVVIVRSPAGNNLNRYRVITAVKTPRVWFNDDPVKHIQQVYPNVVTVDVIDAATPLQLRQELDRRVQSNLRYGRDTNQHTRFVLDWPTDSYTLQINREFNVDMGGGKRHEGIDIAATRGVPVRAAIAGTVFNVTVDPDTLGYGQYVQIQTQGDDGHQYLVTYTQLQNIRVSNGQQVTLHEQIAECGSGWGIKLVVQRAGHQTGSEFTMPGAIDPVPLFYVNGITLHSTATTTLNIRKGQSVEYEKVGDMKPTETAQPLDMHGLTIRKLHTTAEDNKWVNLDTSSGVTGYAAAWYLQARSPRSKLINVATNGINLDALHPLGKPNPSRLGAVTYVRMAYNVSMGRGNQDLNAAYNLYAPYFDSLAKANKRVILVYTHQTYGEGAGYVWTRMDSNRWRELSARLADFLRAIAEQYRSWGIIAAHQIWNEQDAPPEAQASVPIPVGDYSAMLTTTVQAIRAVDPATPIITGGHTGGPVAGANYARTAVAAMPASLRPDGIAAHPYGRGTGSVPRYERFGHIDETVSGYWNVMPGKKIWLTEWGVLNAPQEPAGDVSTYATSFVNHIQRNHADKVAATVWYAWADGMHNGYGLVNQSDQAKEPLYSSYIQIK